MPPKGPIWLSGFYLNSKKCVLEVRYTQDHLNYMKGLFRRNDEIKVTYSSVYDIELDYEMKRELCPIFKSEE